MLLTLHARRWPSQTWVHPQAKRLEIGLDVLEEFLLLVLLVGNDGQISIVGEFSAAKRIDNVVQELQQGFLCGRFCGEPNQGSNRVCRQK